MIESINQDVVLLIIDTDQYAGNFEREITGFITGRHNETSHGEDEAAEFHQFCKDNDKVLLDKEIAFNGADVDYEGHYAVCTIYPTNGLRNINGETVKVVEPHTEGYPIYNSVAIFFRNRPSDEALALMKQRAEEWCDRTPNSDHREAVNITGWRLLKRETRTVETELL